MKADRAVRAIVEGLETRALLAATLENGVSAIYYDNVDGRGKVVGQVEETIDAEHDADESPVEGIAPTNYRVRWTTRLKAPANGKYTFTLDHDDKAALYVNGRRMLFGGNNANEGREASFDMTLRKGRLYSIRLDYTHYNGDSDVQLDWDGPGFDREVIGSEHLFTPANAAPPGDTRPPGSPRQLTVVAKDHDSVTLGWLKAFDNVRVAGYEVLRDGERVARLGAGATRFTDDGLSRDTDYQYQVVAIDAAGNRSAPATVTVTTDAEAGPSNGLTAEYFNDTFLSGTSVRRIDPFVNFNFGTRSPIAGVEPTTYSVRWSGRLRADKTERYTFFTSSDDGVRVKINGQPVIDRFGGLGAQQASGQINLVRGQLYDIEVEYFNQVGNGYVSLQWSSPTTPRRIVPTSNFVTDPLPDDGTTPDAPDASATVLSRSSVRVEWDLVDDAAGYVVERMRGTTGTWQQVFQGSSGATAFTDQGLLSGTQYRYRVRALGDGGGAASDWSTIVSVTTNA